MLGRGAAGGTELRDQSRKFLPRLAAADTELIDRAQRFGPGRVRSLDVRLEAAAANERPCPKSQLGSQLSDEGRFADTGFADNRHDRRARLERRLEQFDKAACLFFSSDELANVELRIAVDRRGLFGPDNRVAATALRFIQRAVSRGK